jgi:hypothetical protein
LIVEIFTLLVEAPASTRDHRLDCRFINLGVPREVGRKLEKIECPPRVTVRCCRHQFDRFRSRGSCGPALVICQRPLQYLDEFRLRQHLQDVHTCPRQQRVVQLE